MSKFSQKSWSICKFKEKHQRERTLSGSNVINQITRGKEYSNSKHIVKLKDTIFFTTVKASLYALCLFIIFKSVYRIGFQFSVYLHDSQFILLFYSDAW